MSVTNQDLIQKGVITAEALAAAGKLSPKQAEQFIDFVVDETSLKGRVRVARFTNESLEIDKIGVGRRVAVPKAEAVAPDVRRGIQTSKVTLTPKEIIVPFEIGDNFLELNIQGQSVEERIIRMMATQFANDIEELYLRGDILGEAALEADLIEGGSNADYVRDSYLALFDGWLRLADQGGHRVDLEGAQVGPTVFSKLLNAMPNKFKRNRGNLRFLTSPELEQDFRQHVATRQTAAGDAALSARGNTTPFGVELESVALFPYRPAVVEHLALPGETAVGLRYRPVTDLVVSRSDLGKTAQTAFVAGTDYTVDEAAGTVARIGGGAIGDGDIVKLTYRALPQVLLTALNNLIVGIGRDIRIERDRDIFKGANQFAITAKVSAQVEELDAVVKGVNVASAA